VWGQSGDDQGIKVIVEEEVVNEGRVGQERFRSYILVASLPRQSWWMNWN